MEEVLVEVAQWMTMTTRVMMVECATFPRYLGTNYHTHTNNVASCNIPLYDVWLVNKKNSGI